MTKRRFVPESSEHRGTRDPSQTLVFPKQLHYWLQKVGVRPGDHRYFNERGVGKVLYFEGRRRLYRINCYGWLDISETRSRFDRWANSHMLAFDLRGLTTEAAFIQRFREMNALAVAMERHMREHRLWWYTATPDDVQRFMDEYPQFSPAFVRRELRHYVEHMQLEA